jgi:hypothetical protein
MRVPFLKATTTDEKTTPDIKLRNGFIAFLLSLFTPMAWASI